MPGSSFCYQILAADSGGRAQAPTGYPACATTPTLPLPVTGLIAQATSSTTIALEWQASSGAAYYVIWASDSPGGPFNTIGTSNIPSYSVSGLLPGRTYCYLILAVNSTGNAAAPSGPPACVTTPAITPPVNVGAVTRSSSSILITWNKPPGATGYTIYRSKNPAGPFTTSAGTSNVESFLDSGLSANTTYYYEVTASNNTGYTSVLSTPPASAMTAPPVPTGITSKALSPTSVEIKWNPSTGAVRYDVYRGPNLNGTGSMKVGTPTGPLFVDTVPSGSSWFYWVTASNTGGESSRSNFTSVTTPPAAPANVTLALISGQNYRISWNASAGATGYTLNRQVPGSSQWTPVSTITAGTSVTVTPGTAGIRFYMVTASNSGGTSPPSNVVQL